MNDLALLPENPDLAAAFERGWREMLEWIEANIPPLEFPEQDDKE